MTTWRWCPLFGLLLAVRCAAQLPDFITPGVSFNVALGATPSTTFQTASSTSYEQISDAVDGSSNTKWIFYYATSKYIELLFPGPVMLQSMEWEFASPVYALTSFSVKRYYGSTGSSASTLCSVSGNTGANIGTSTCSWSGAKRASKLRIYPTAADSQIWLDEWVVNGYVPEPSVSISGTNQFSAGDSMSIAWSSSLLTGVSGVTLRLYLAGSHLMDIGCDISRTSASHSFVLPSGLESRADYSVALVWKWGASETIGTSGPVIVLADSVATGKTVTDTGSGAAWAITSASLLAQIVDGSTGTRLKWPYTGNGFVDSNGDPFYGYRLVDFTVDLGAAYEITKIVLRWWGNASWKSHAPRNYYVKLKGLASGKLSRLSRHPANKVRRISSTCLDTNLLLDSAPTPPLDHARTALPISSFIVLSSTNPCDC